MPPEAVTQAVETTAAKAGAAAQQATTDRIFDVKTVETPPPQVTLPQAPKGGASSDLITGPAAEAQLGLNEAQTIQEAETEQDRLRKKLEGAFDFQTRIADEEAELGEEVELEDKRREVNDINNKILVKQRAFENNIRRIDEDQTLTAAQKQARISEIESKQAREMADMSITKQVTLNDFATAQAYVDRKVEAMTEGARNKIEAIKFFYSENKDVLTQAQNRQFQRLMRREESALRREEDRIKRTEDQKLQLMQNARLNGAPIEVIENIARQDSIESAERVAGEYGVDTSALLGMEQQRASIDASRASAAASFASAGAARALQQQREVETALLLNPPADAGLDQPTLDVLDNLNNGQREAITQSRETVGEIDRMIELVESAGDMSLLTKATEEGREFLRLRANLVDKLARERTGAVVGNDEEATFKDILGVGLFDVIAKDDEEVINGLLKFKQPHQESLALNDPTGKVTNYLDAIQVAEDEDEINAIWDQTGLIEEFNAAQYY